MGPNVKFVSAITDAFSNKKNGGQFFSGKNTKPGGGVQGRFGKRPYFCTFFYLFPYLKSDEISNSQQINSNQLQSLDTLDLGTPSEKERD